MKLDPAYGDAWLKPKIGNIVKKWTSNPGAAAFAAPKADCNLVPLKFADQRALEKQLIGLQAAAGGVGAITTRVLWLMEEKAKVLTNTAKQYKDGEVPIANPREEAGEIMLAVKSSIMDVWSKDMAELAKLAGAMYNNMMLMRRFALVFVCLMLCIGVLFQGTCTCRGSSRISRPEPR